MRIISPESFLNLTFLKSSISHVIQFKTFLRPLLKNGIFKTFVKIDFRHLDFKTCMGTLIRYIEIVI